MTGEEVGGLGIQWGMSNPISLHNFPLLNSGKAGLLLELSKYS